MFFLILIQYNFISIYWIQYYINCKIQFIYFIYIVKMVTEVPLLSSYWNVDQIIMEFIKIQ